MHGVGSPNDPGRLTGRDAGGWLHIRGRPMAMARRLPWSRPQRNRFDRLGGKADFSYWQC
jgi:hypothetical protein